MNNIKECQDVFDICGINEEVQGLTLYTSSRFEKHAEVITDRVAYDLNLETLSDIQRLQGTQDIKNYIMGCQI